MHPAHDQPARDLPFLGVGDERGEADLGDFRLADPPLVLGFPNRSRIPVVVHDVPGMAMIAGRAEEFIRTVTENHALAVTAAAMRSRR